MEHKNELTNIFSPSGCLTEEAVRSYVSGTLPGDLHEQVKHHLEQCEFCAMAMEGTAAIIQEKGEEAYGILISETRSALDEKTINAFPEKPSRKVRTIWSVAAVAATVIMLLGLYQVIKMFVPENKQLAQVKTDTTVTQEFSEINVPPPAMSEESGNVVEPAGNKFKMITPITNKESRATEELKLSDKLNAVVDEDYNMTAEAKPVHPVTTITKPLTDSLSITGIRSQMDEKVQMAPAGNMAYGVTSKNLSKSEVNMSSEKDFSVAAKGEAYNPKEDNASPVFTVVEEMPEFPGGEDARARFFKDKIQYPKTAKESGVSGTVYVSFVVDEKGRIKDARVIKGIGSGCDEEALRVIKLMPRWVPGKQAGKPVRVQFTLPVKFTVDQ